MFSYSHLELNANGNVRGMPEKKKLTGNNLRYYATFKVRKFESLFYKTSTFLQKTTTCIELQTEQILSGNI